MAIQQENRHFTLKSAIGALIESVTSHWKLLLVAAPLIGTALFLASGTQAQTSSSPAPSASTTANGPVAPIASPEAARRKGPKEKRKEATARVANPSTPGVPAADVPIAPIDAPDAARTGRPKEKEKEATNDSAASSSATTEPVTPPTERRRRGPKVRDDPVYDTSRTGGRPKERDPTPTNDRVANPLPAPEAERTGRGAKPKGAVDHGRASSTPLIIGALGAATILALVVSSGNDRPASP
jgi:hypothetical protein